jgi:hypothetical protein
MVMSAMAALRRRGGTMAISSVAIGSVVMGSMVVAAVIVPVTMCCRRAAALKGLGGDHQRDCDRLLQHSGDKSGEHPCNQGAREYALEHSVSAMIGQ